MIFNHGHSTLTEFETLKIIYHYGNLFVSLFSAPSLYIRKEGATHHPDSTNFQFYNETYLIFEVIFLEMR